MKAIVAVDENWGIGRDNDLLFSIPEDMAFFRSTTAGKTVVMGRSTLGSLPGGRPLKNRNNVVLSRNPELRVPGALVCRTLAELGNALAGCGSGDVFVMGGAEIYALLLPFCEEALVTKVFADGAPQKYFPNLDAAAGWRLAGQSEERAHGPLRFRFCSYRNGAPIALPRTGT